MVINKTNLHVTQFLEPIVRPDPFLEAAQILNQAAQNDTEIQQTIRTVMDWGVPIDIPSLEEYRQIRRPGIKSNWPDKFEATPDVLLGAGYLVAESALRTPSGLKKFAEGLKDGKQCRQKVEGIIDTLEPDFVGVLLTEAERTANTDTGFAKRLAQASDYLVSLEEKFPQFRKVIVPGPEITEPRTTKREPGSVKTFDDPSRPIAFCNPFDPDSTTKQNILCGAAIVVVVVVTLLLK